MTIRHVCTWPESPCAWCNDTINHLQLCAHAGCINCVDDRDPATGELVTIADPDNPDHTVEAWHCNLCLSRLDVLHADSGCGYCIDGWAPVFDQLLGPAYQTCRRCRAGCPVCQGRSRFGASLFDYENGELVYDNTIIIAILVEHQLRPFFCPTCYGLIIALPITSSDTGGDQP
jgi:hypothetical protein